MCRHSRSRFATIFNFSCTSTSLSKRDKTDNSSHKYHKCCINFFKAAPETFSSILSYDFKDFKKQRSCLSAFTSALQLSHAITCTVAMNNEMSLKPSHVRQIAIHIPLKRLEFEAVVSLHKICTLVSRHQCVVRSQDAANLPGDRVTRPPSELAESERRKEADVVKTILFTSPGGFLKGPCRLTVGIDHPS
ncbi:hypothetical protein AVEN_233903-1 [Araneus ventricosus]|uniref:Uncharacterized protein n=1 Tax=Araneus ventricosus TaxID=182803 RepID=A0A4Y1ZMW6_ARAVE|nr:hypothetical protein AVEN_233903-1 [Araneus ventricosus]